MSETGQFELVVKHVRDYEFNVKFDWADTASLTLDEPAPLGREQGPNAARLVAAAAGNCLSASLMFCIAKSDVPADSVLTRVTGRMERNENGRLRIGRIEVDMTVCETLAEAVRLKRCLVLFEDFCVVTASLRDGISVGVTVRDAAGEVLHEHG
ncbi:MAG: OsmC family protein [Pseudomonadota bacterium]|nr:OsmC family protein [Pseudomonadota bacterium]